MKNQSEMDEILSVLQSNSRVQEMKKYIQHGNVSTYDHCEAVAKLSYWIDQQFSLHSDLKVLLIGAMLHDFYLYDWHNEDDGSHHLHGLKHAETACENAKKYFQIDDKTSRVISCHMWPLNPEKVPMTKEEWIVCIADKWVSLQETLFKRSTQR